MQGIEIWSKVNESVKLIAWPGVVAVALIMFRTKLGDLFQRLREADTPAGSVRFDAGGQAAISTTAGNLIETVRGEIVASQAASADGTSEASLKPIDMRDVKDDVEAVIRASFAAGFRAAYSVNASGTRMKQGRTPRPTINWNEAVPEVQGYSIWGPDVETPDTGIVDLFIARDQRKKVLRQLADDQERIRQVKLAILDDPNARDRVAALTDELTEASETYNYHRDKLQEFDEQINDLDTKYPSGDPK